MTLSSRRFAGYLFDLDGTLVDTAPDLMHALNHVLDSAQLPRVDEPTTRHWVGHGVRAMLAAALAHHDTSASEEQLDALFDACLSYYGDHVCEGSQPYPTVRETVTELAAQVPLAVVTNKPTDLAEKLLAALDMRRYFGSVVGRGTTRSHKPSAEPALYACAELGIDVADVLFVGDSATDVACARAAGCPVALYRHGYNHGQNPETLGADWVIDSMAALLPDDDG